MKLEKQIEIIEQLLEGIAFLKEHHLGWDDEYKNGEELLSYLKNLQSIYINGETPTYNPNPTFIPWQPTTPNTTDPNVICQHSSCTSCHGTGFKQDGTTCVHNLYCSCPKCSPRC